jgi:hypothetical protein
MRKFFILLLFAFPGLILAQQTERVLVNGVITAPVGEDLEGISVYNVSAQKGTITNANGEFSLEMGINDRVLFSALQFQKFTIIVDEGIIQNRSMKVYVNPAVTTLDEIIVRPHDLTGNIRVDVSRIKTVDLDTSLNISWEEMEFDFEFADDPSSGVENVAVREVPTAGLNVLGLVGLLGETLFRKRDTTTQKLTPLEKAQLADASYTAIYQRFAHDYFIEVLKIPKDQIENFLYFVTENGFRPDLVQENNELKLMDFLEKQSKIYLARTE